MYKRILYIVCSAHKCTFYIMLTLTHDRQLYLNTPCQNGHWLVFLFMNKYVHSDRYLKRSINEFHLWTSYSKELIKQVLEPSLPSVLQIQTSQKPLSENSSSLFAILNGSEYIPAVSWFHFPDTVGDPHFLFLYTKSRTVKLGIFFQNDSPCSNIAPPSISMRIFHSLPKFLKYLPGAKQQPSSSQFQWLSTPFLLLNTRQGVPLLTSHPVCLCPSLSFFVSLPLPSSSHLTFPKIWVRGQECNRSRKWLCFRNVIIGMFHSRNTGLIEVEEIKNHFSYFGSNLNSASSWRIFPLTT